MPRRGLSIILWKYALFELWRVMLLTAFVLVAVISFAATVKPLADGKIGPLDALRFIGLAVVPMLQYALPFAAGFAATLTYHRLSQDNEVAAAYASGVSPRAVLAPAILSGLILAVVLAGLNHAAIPRFLRSMQQLITQDLAKIMVNSIERGQAVPIGNNMQLYADRVERLDPKSDPRLKAAGASQWLLLQRLAAIETTSTGKVKAEMISNQAQLVLFPPADQTDQGHAVMQLERGVLVQEGKAMVSAEETRPLTWSVNNAFRDDPKFLSFTELERLRDRPEDMNWIEQKRRDMAYHIAERLTTEAIQKQLTTAGQAVFIGNDGQQSILRASGISLGGRGRWIIAPPKPGAAVEVELLRPAPGGKPTGSMVITAHDASMFTSMNLDTTSRDLTVRLELNEASTKVLSSDARTQASSGGVLSQKVLAGLRVQDNPVEELLDREHWPARKMLTDLADPRTRGENPDLFIQRPADDMRRSLSRLMREITSKQHERWAMSVACFVMIVTGSLTALRLSHSLPLTVYLWSFFPALATVITISSGQQLTHNKGPIGLVVLWGGVAAFAAYAAVVYWKLRRR